MWLCHALVVHCITLATDCTEDVAKKTLDDEGFERDKLLGSISECKENGWFHSYCMKNLIHHFPTCYTYSVKKPIGN